MNRSNVKPVFLFFFCFPSRVSTSGERHVKSTFGTIQVGMYPMLPGVFGAVGAFWVSLKPSHQQHSFFCLQKKRTLAFFRFPYRKPQNIISLARQLRQPNMFDHGTSATATATAWGSLLRCSFLLRRGQHWECHRSARDRLGELHPLAAGRRPKNAFNWWRFRTVMYCL